LETRTAPTSDEDTQLKLRIPLLGDEVFDFGRCRIGKYERGRHFGYGIHSQTPELSMGKLSAPL